MYYLMNTICACLYKDKIVTRSEKTRHIVQTRIWRNARFSTTGKKMLKSSFCHIHVRKPFYYPLPSPTEGKRKLPRQTKPSFRPT